MKHPELISYQLTTTSYGQVRVTPMVLANELSSRLEQWFQNCKFNYLAVSGFQEELYDVALQVEFIYSRRVLPIRDYSNIKSEIMMEMSLLSYHLLVKIIHEFIEVFYKVYLVLTQGKQGQGVLDFESIIKKQCAVFHKKNFPDKLDFFEMELSLASHLDGLKNINRVRNCLEHRQGIVSKDKDCDHQKNYMSIKWKYLKILSQYGEVTPLSNFKGKLDTSESFVEEIKRFPVGKRIELDFYDNYKCIYTIIDDFKKIIDALYLKLGMDQEKTPVIVRTFGD